MLYMYMVVASLCLWMRSYFLLCYDFILICFHCNHSKENLPKHIYIYNIIILLSLLPFVHLVVKMFTFGKLLTINGTIYVQYVVYILIQIWVHYDVDFFYSFKFIRKNKDTINGSSEYSVILVYSTKIILVQRFS